MVVKGKKQQRKLRKLFIGKKHRLPRKLKKSLRNYEAILNRQTGEFYVNRIDGKYDKTKWDRRAVNHLRMVFVKAFMRGIIEQMQGAGVLGTDEQIKELKRRLSLVSIMRQG